MTNQYFVMLSQSCSAWYPPQEETFYEGTDLLVSTTITKASDCNKECFNQAACVVAMYGNSSDNVPTCWLKSTMGERSIMATVTAYRMKRRGTMVCDNTVNSMLKKLQP
jgi:hypothetical protein